MKINEIKSLTKKEMKTGVISFDVDLNNIKLEKDKSMNIQLQVGTDDNNKKYKRFIIVE